MRSLADFSEWYELESKTLLSREKIAGRGISWKDGKLTVEIGELEESVVDEGGVSELEEIVQICKKLEGEIDYDVEGMVKRIENLREKLELLGSLREQVRKRLDVLISLSTTYHNHEAKDIGGAIPWDYIGTGEGKFLREDGVWVDLEGVELDGVFWLEGLEGEPGEEGDPGDPGDEGDKGDTTIGSPGEEGDPGDPGDEGEPGIDGFDGRLIYITDRNKIVWDRTVNFNTSHRLYGDYP